MEASMDDDASHSSVSEVEMKDAARDDDDDAEEEEDEEEEEEMDDFGSAANEQLLKRDEFVGPILRTPGVYEPHEFCSSVVHLPCQRRWVVIRHPKDSSGRQRRVVVFTSKYKPFNEKSERGAEYRALLASGLSVELKRIREAVQEFAMRVDEGYRPTQEQFIKQLRIMMGDAKQVGKKEMREKVEEALKKGRKVKRNGQVFVEYLNDAKDTKGRSVSYGDLAEIIMNPVVEALYLGSDLYKEEVAKIRAGFFRQERLSHRTVHGNYLDYVRTWGKKKGLYSKMLKKAYGKLLDDETLEKLEGWMQTDHLLAPICDDPQNFFLMFRTLNNKFSFEDLLEFKKNLTGDGWEGAVELANSAVRLQLAAL